MASINLQVFVQKGLLDLLDGHGYRSPLHVKWYSCTDANNLHLCDGFQVLSLFFISWL